MKKGHYNRIKAALAEGEITSKELGEALDVTPAMVSHWCTNNKQPSIETLFRIASYLDIDVRELLVSSKVVGKAVKKN